jgi:tRNA pseudouridine55 synthase
MDGALIIDKPAGITSHDVVARVRKILGERRVGHTGTLDPFATGVLVVLVSRATRLAQFLSGAEKEYEAVIRLGYATDTGDVTGKRMNAEGFTTETRRTRSFSKEEIEAALARLRGEIEQTPPMYSAKKIAGRKLYELARQGDEVERKPVRVTVKKFEVQTHDGSLLKHNEDGTCDLAVRVVCSAGTYVRSLAEAVGERLGTGAHLFALRRTRAGEFKIEDAISLGRLSALAESGTVEQGLISPDAALAHLPAVQLEPADVPRVQQGIDLGIEDPEASRWSDGQRVRMRGANRDLIAVGVYNAAVKSIHPSVVIANRD